MWHHNENSSFSLTKVAGGGVRPLGNHSPPFTVDAVSREQFQFFLEIFESCGALMILVYRLVPAKIVFQTERRPEKQGHSRPATGDFAFSFES